ncbi:MAG: outer membrane lipoprotein carrier protein LolA [Paenibacillaceae bacterium]|nr:outer membrane lipoprotein carrier protein LolA [Paenibacillaceae bacterium]
MNTPYTCALGNNFMIVRMILITLPIALLLGACASAPDLAGVSADMEHVAAKMKSYHATGTMTVYTSKKPQQYDVDVRYSEPHFYRIALTNRTKQVQQIVLRNDNGVYVITPHLRKSFRFQSDWPHKQGQAYLYETLMQAILSDSSAKFVPQSQAYVFDVAANYNNISLIRQKIWIDRKTLLPTQVLVTDQHMQDAVRVNFATFETNKSIDRALFDPQQNMMRVSLQTIPVIQSQATTAPSLHMYAPAYVPTGVNANTPFSASDNDAIVMRYTGAYNFTITQKLTKNDDVASSALGSLVTLDEGYGVLLDTGSLHWTENNQDYILASSDLPNEERMRIARSLERSTEK